MRTSLSLSCCRLSGLVCCFFAISWSLTCCGDDRRPSVVDKTTAKEVAKLLQERHLSRRPLDDEAAKRAFDLYIKALDSAKVYLTQADIDEFAANKSQLDDMLIKGDVKLAFAIFDRFLQRVDERVAMAVKMVDDEIDFTVDEEIVVDPKSLEYPKTEDEADDRWRKRIKYNLLVLKSEKDAEGEPKEVAELRQELHLNAEAAKRAFVLFVKALDSAKVYLTQADIDEFATNKLQIDDMLIKGDVTRVFAIFDLFLQRVDKRVAMALKSVDKDAEGEPKEIAELRQELQLSPLPPDDKAAQRAFVLFVKALDPAKVYLTQADIDEFATNKLQIDDMLIKGDVTRVFAIFDRFLQRVKMAVNKERLKKRFKAFKNRMHQFDNEDIVETFVTAVTMGYDPHTTYFSKSSYENFEIEMGLQLEGIGATLASTDDGLTEIKRIVPGGAADKSGYVKVDDKIVAVGQGSEGEMVDVTDMKLDDVVHLIRGNAGTIVRLNILPGDSNEIKSFTITREKIELKDSEAHGIVFDVGKKADGSPYKIGVIDLPSFYSDMNESNRNSNYKSATRDMKRILGEFKQQKIDAVVLDLSLNGGGSLREAVDISGLFIDRGPIVQVKDSFGQIRALNDTVSGMSWDGPLVVMTSKFSASASEILAGAIQDYKRGIVVGDSATHGKGTVQNLIDLNQEIFQVAEPTDRIYGAFKVTMQQFYRPQGDSTQKRGVLADVVLPSITDHMDVSESDLDYAVDFDKVPTARFSALNLVTNESLEKLRQRSEERRQASEDFVKRQKDIGLYIDQKDKKSLSLSEEKFFARRKELNADKEDEKMMEKQANPGEIKRDFFMEEILSITVDYMEDLASGGVAVK